MSACCAFVCLCVCLSACGFVYLSACGFVCLPVGLFVCLPVGLFVCLPVCFQASRNVLIKEAAFCRTLHGISLSASASQAPRQDSCRH